MTIGSIILVVLLAAAFAVFFDADLPLDDLTPLAPTFLHDSVTLWGNNTSASNLTLTHPHPH